MGRVQARAREKFPHLPYIWGPPEALEQASGFAVASWKARRLAPLTHGRPLFDLCAGIGGDTLALAQVAPVTAIDLSPVRMRCLQWNAAATNHPIHPQGADISELLPTLSREGLFHIDPARRRHDIGKIKRSHRYQDLLPGPPILDAVIHHFAGGMLKLSPAVDFDSLPQGHVEVLSEAGTIVQAVLYVGILSPAFPSGTRTATILRPGMAAFSFSAPPEVRLAPSPPPAEAEGRYLYEVDGAVTRAGLAPALARECNLLPLTIDGGYLLSASPLPPPHPPSSALSHPALKPFRIRAILPFSPRRFAQTLAQFARPGDPLGPIEVKTRGLPELSTDDLQKALSKASPHRRTLLLFRQGQRLLAAIADRVATP
jgi:hypothetical protein